MDQPNPTPKTTELAKKLLRSKKSRYLGGVCGGLGEYFNIDPTLIRLAFVLFTFAGGSGVLIYILCWLFIPEAGQEQATVEQRVQAAGEEMKGGVDKVMNEVRQGGPERGNYIVGLILIVIGAMAFANTYTPWRIFRWEVMWPGLLIIFGLVIIFRRK